MKLLEITGLPPLLTALFIGLKLGHVIDWSWWWVLSPILISGAFTIVLILGMLLLTGEILGDWWDQ